MKFVLDKSNVFEEEINVKINEIIEQYKNDFQTGQAYELTIRFDVCYLDDKRFDKIVIPTDEKCDKNTLNDKISHLLNSEAFYQGKGKNKNRMKVRSIIANKRSYLIELLSFLHKCMLKK